MSEQRLVFCKAMMIDSLPDLLLVMDTVGAITLLHVIFDAIPNLPVFQASASVFGLLCETKTLLVL